MSGGHFDYKQYTMDFIIDDIERIIAGNDDETLTEYGCRKGRGYSQETIQRFGEAIKMLRLAQIYTHRIDWLLSGDDSEESFHVRLQEELENSHSH